MGGWFLLISPLLLLLGGYPGKGENKDSYYNSSLGYHSTDNIREKETLK